MKTPTIEKLIKYLNNGKNILIAHKVDNEGNNTFVYSNDEQFYHYSQNIGYTYPSNKILNITGSLIASLSYQLNSKDENSPYKARTYIITDSNKDLEKTINLIIDKYPVLNNSTLETMQIQIYYKNELILSILNTSKGFNIKESIKSLFEENNLFNKI